jgi:hypothetical protein
VTLRGSVRAWLPPGTWIDLFTETVYDGDRELELHRDGRSIPALVRAGGIVPLAAPDDVDATRNPERLEIVVAPGADGAFTLIEDDGTGATPADIPTARTPLAWDQAAGELAIGPAEDPHGVLPARREWTLRLLGTDVVESGSGAPGERLVVSAGADPGASTPERSDRLFAVLATAQYETEAKAAAWATLSSDQPVAAQLAELHAQGLPHALVGALAELLTAR